jgi:hypothetical protein
VVEEGFADCPKGGARPLSQFQSSMSGQANRRAENA